MPSSSNTLASTLALNTAAPSSSTSYVQPAAPEPEENGTANTTVAVAASGDARIDGLLIGTKWSGGITYSDVDSPLDYQGGYFSDQDGDGTSAQNEGFSQFTAGQTLAMHAALNDAIYTQPSGYWGFSIEGFTNLSVTYAGAGTGSATIRAANSSDAGTAYAFYPNDSIYGGDTFFGNNYDGTTNSLKNPVAGNYAWHTMLHELGHSLGLKHGQSTGGPGNTALPTAYDSIEYSVMTYRSYVGAPLNGYTYEQFGAPQTYMMLDIAALQYMYGADFGVNSGDTTYTWDASTGASYVNGVLAIAPGANRIFSTIWDGAGIDTYDLSNYTTNLSVDLRPGEHSTFSSGQLAYLGDGNYARGNVFNALLYQGNTSSLIENATGGSGNDVLRGNDIANTLIGNAGVDSLYGGYGNDTLNGGGHNDYLFGESGIDTLYGGEGDDHIEGGFSKDAVFGEGGNDTFRVLEGEFGDDTDGGTGIDTLDLSNYTSTGAIIDLAGGTYDLNPSFGGPYTIVAVENVNGTQVADTIIGNDEANFIQGNGGDDSLRGGGGNDIFDGGSGIDQVYGQGGDDTFKLYNGWNGGFGEAFFGGAGLDTFDISGTVGVNAVISLEDGEFSYNGSSSGLVWLSSVENIISGWGDDVLTGSGEGNNIQGGGGNDTLNGRDGNDWLDGNGGVDAMTGGAGNDIFYIDNTADTVFEFKDEGKDSVRTTVTYSLVGQFVELLVLLEGSAIDGFGNGLDNNINGNSFGNLLDGGKGADRITGKGGDDIYIVDNAGDKVIEIINEGYDTVRSSVTFSLTGQYVEALELTGSLAINGTGNNLNNLITGNGADNVINGGIGVDEMTGGAGNDTFYVDNLGDDVNEAKDEGTDFVFASVNYSLVGRFVETLTLTGSANLNAFGNGQVNTLIGNSGNNTLDGGALGDTLSGGAGNDIYVVDNLGDTVTELNGEGADTVRSSVSFSLSGIYVETLELTGAAAINGTGNSFANTIVGNSGANRINGHLGDDTLTGNGGADTFVFNQAVLTTNVDTITDFDTANDLIELDRSWFSGISADGPLSVGAFWAGTAAHDATDRIIYNAATGDLFYDADGNGAIAARLFAHLDPGLALSAADFVAVP